MIRAFTAVLVMATLAASTFAAEPRSDRSRPPARAAEPPPPPPPPERYQPPRTAGEPEGLEPEVTIRTRGTEVHEEYRYNGQLYMVKVTPARGASYYLIYDERGASRRSDLEPDVAIPNWVIKRF